MSKIYDKIKQRQQGKGNLRQDEGLIRVSFVFGGRKYVREHQMNRNEMDSTKEMLKENGGDAFSSAIVKSALFVGRNFGEYVVGEAMKEYGREHYLGDHVKQHIAGQLPQPQEITTQEVMEALAKSRGIVLGKTEMEGMDDMAGIEVDKRVEKTEELTRQTIANRIVI